MSFARPEFLLLAVTLPLAALCLYLAARGRRALADALSLPRAAGGRRGKHVLFLAGLALAVIGAAGPRLGVAPAAAPAPTGNRALVVAVDCSRSMLARDVAPDRLAAAKAAALSVLSRLPDVPVAVVGFAGRAWLACPVTSDRAGLALFLDALSPDAAPLGGTSLAAALEASRLALAGVEYGAVLLFSDGEETLAARDAGAVTAGGPPVLTVAVGGPAPVPVPTGRGQVLRDASGAPVLVGVDAPSLAAVAATSGGRAFRLAPDAADPVPAIAAALRARFPEQAAGEGAAPPRDLSAYFFLAALLFFACDLALRPGRGASALLVLPLCLLAPTRATAGLWGGLDRGEAARRTQAGLEAFAAGRDDAALQAFLRARVQAPDSPELLYDLGTASYRLGRFARAREFFARAAATAGTDSLRAKALYNQGNAAYRAGDADAAIAGYEAALTVDPRDADARANLDWLRARQQQKPPEGQGDKAGEKPKTAAEAKSGDKESAEGKGNAPSPKGQDDGSGGERQDGRQPVPAADAPGRPGPGEAVVPLAAPQGEKAGEKRAATPGSADDPILSRVPDLPGLPETPGYGRPTVAKDW